MNPGLDFLSKRKVSIDSIKLFNLGYKDSQGNVLGCRGLDASSMPTNSILIPIYDCYGVYKAMSSRKLDGDVKYIHEKNFKMHDHLYGLDKALQSIIYLNCVVIVEGFFDMISLYTRGVQNAVAVCGTSPSWRQVNMLSRFCNNIIVAFDGDAAGIKSANDFKRQIDKDSSINCSIFDMPLQKDPDELEGKEWENLCLLANSMQKKVAV